MSVTTTPAVREIIDRALQLSPADREQIANELLGSVYPPDDPEEVKKAWRAERQRRIDAIDNGTRKTYSLAETMVHLRPGT